MKNINFIIADDFLKASIDVKKFSNDLEKHFKESGYTDNEKHLFKHFLIAQFSFNCTIAKIKSDML